MVVFDESKQEKQLEKLREREEEKLVKLLSKKYGLPFLESATLSINNTALGVVKEEEARTAVVAPFDIKGKQVSIAIFSPQDKATTGALARIEESGYKISLFMASHATLEKIWLHYKDVSLAQKTEAGVLDISGGDLNSLVEKFHTIEDIKAAVETAISAKGAHTVSTIFEILLGGAIAVGASDIHLEPEEEQVRIRYRLDGVLQTVIMLDHKMFHLLISRIKLLSGLKLNVTEDTQDGRFSIKIADLDIEIRTSTLPGPYGEAGVLRILNPQAISVTLEQLGIEKGLLTILLKEIKKPNGMILTTGPTGSGKTTTLYAFLKKIYSPEIKIITIEDPIEYHLDGITQTQVDSKSNYTFLSGLRAALRQDPDVIMVGEIRDGETAKIAVNSALTGHMVLSTLHTNNAAGTIPRLIDLGINPKVLGSALSVAIAQRLIRKLCEECKKEHTPTERETAIIKSTLASAQKKRPEETLDVDSFKMWAPEGCTACNDSGYKGRIGVYEAILMDKKLEELLTENPNEREIQEATNGQGIFNMQEDGILKVIAGSTSLEELERVVELSQENE